jgi:hypothetical protein
MHNLVRFDLIKYTGKSGYARDVNCIGFKSIDTSTNDENADVLNYPVYAPYLNPRSFSYENWIKFKLTLILGEDDILSSRGLTIKEECGDYCYNRTYTKIKNISIWFNNVPDTNVIVRVGQSQEYIRPVDTLSEIAVEDVKSYFVDNVDFNNNIKIPLYFDGKNEIEINKVSGSVNDTYIVFQQEVLKGLKYQLDYRPFKINLHYEVE